MREAAWAESCNQGGVCAASPPRSGRSRGSPPRCSRAALWRRPRCPHQVAHALHGGDISSMVLPASRRAGCRPRRVRSNPGSVLGLGAAAANAARGLRHSRATTAKPRPARPRGGSTAAVSARMLVWKAIPSMMTDDVGDLARRASIWPIVPTTPRTTVPQCAATSAARTAWSAASRAFLELRFTVVASSRSTRRLLQARRLLLGALREVGVASESSREVDRISPPSASPAAPLGASSRAPSIRRRARRWRRLPRGPAG